MPPKDSYADRVFTIEVVAFPGTVHIDDEKDFTPVIEKALELGGFSEDKDFTGINGGSEVTTGFGHAAILSHADAFGCEVNQLPLSFVLSWYEQKAVCILLTLLHLGIKNIRLGPSLPAFVSKNILNFLVENYGIAPITTPEEDLKSLLNIG